MIGWALRSQRLSGLSGVSRFYALRRDDATAWRGYYSPRNAALSRSHRPLAPAGTSVKHLLRRPPIFAASGVEDRFQKLDQGALELDRSGIAQPLTNEVADLTLRVPLQQQRAQPVSVRLFPMIVEMTVAGCRYTDVQQLARARIDVNVEAAIGPHFG